MNDIIVSRVKDEGMVFEVQALITQLEKIPDERMARGKRHRLSLVLLLVLLAKLAGEQKPSGIAEWLRLRQRYLVKALNYPHTRLPSLNTIRRVLRQEPVRQKLPEVLCHFLHQQFGGQQSVLVTIDGKTLRGTIPPGQKHGVHLLAAYLPGEGVTLCQLPVGNKENEIVVAPQLLSALDLRGRVVCGDALFTQRSLSVQVLAQGGHYIWTVKANQPTLRDDVAQFFLPPRCVPGWQAPRMPETGTQTIHLGHGRCERRTLRLIPDENHFIDWPGLQQVFQIERHRIQQRTGEVSTETVYGITSLPPSAVSAAQLLEWVQSYWGIENGLHYRRDVTLDEDAQRMIHSAQAEVTATLNNFIVGFARKLGFNNLASAQRQFEAMLTVGLAGFA